MGARPVRRALLGPFASTRELMVQVPQRDFGSLLLSLGLKQSRTRRTVSVTVGSESEQVLSQTRTFLFKVTASGDGQCKCRWPGAGWPCGIAAHSPLPARPLWTHLRSA